NARPHVSVVNVDLTSGCQHLAVSAAIGLRHDDDFRYVGDDLAGVSLDEMLTEQGSLQFGGIPHVIYGKAGADAEMDDIPSPHPLNQLADGDFCQPQAEGVAHRALVSRAST